MDVNALMQMLGMGGPARANPLEHLAMGAPPPTGGNEVMAKVDQAKREEEILRQLQRQQMMSEAAAGGYRPNTDMQMMQLIQSMLARR